MSERPIVWTPGALRARGRRLDRHIRRLARELQRSVAAGRRPAWDESEAVAWVRFLEQWQEWWNGWVDAPLGTGYWGATAAALDDWEAEFREWRQRAIDAGAEIRTPSVESPEPTRFLADLSPVVWGVAAIGALWVFSSWGRVRTE